MAAHENRFEFPGFQHTADRDTDTHEVVVGTVQDGSAIFVVEVIRNNLMQGMNFLLAKVTPPKGSSTWMFPQEKFGGIGLLAKAGDAIVIALTGKGKLGKVERVIPFSHLVDHKPIDLRKQIELKRLAADFLRRDFNLTPVESALGKVDNIRRFEEEEAAREEEREARRIERRDRVLAIKARTRLTVFTADGSARHGYPVTEAEWPSLPNETFVILVESFVEDKSGAVIESFKVVKPPGKNAVKGSRVPVTSERPMPKAAIIAPKPVGMTVIEKNGNAHQVTLFRTMEDIRLARAAGLNSGTLAAVMPSAKGGVIEVHEVHADQVGSWGRFTPITDVIPVA